MSEPSRDEQIGQGEDILTNIMKLAKSPVITVITGDLESFILFFKIRNRNGSDSCSGAALAKHCLKMCNVVLLQDTEFKDWRKVATLVHTEKEAEDAVHSIEK